MNKLTLIGSNVLTALVTAAVTSAFWLVAFNHGSLGTNRKAAAPPQPAEQSVGSTGGDDVFVGATGFVIPVAGIKPADLVDTYRQARAGGARVHDAIDIMAPHGTPVVAAAPGRVEKLYFSEGGGGVTAYVRSPDNRYLYYYAHLQDYAPGLREGQVVARGDMIGRVGSSGNANPDGPHLHFAIHRMQPGDKWHMGTPLNPYPLLVGKPVPG